VEVQQPEVQRPLELVVHQDVPLDQVEETIVSEERLTLALSEEHLTHKESLRCIIF